METAVGVKLVERKTVDYKPSPLLWEMTDEERERRLRELREELSDGRKATPAQH